MKYHETSSDRMDSTRFIFNIVQDSLVELGQRKYCSTNEETCPARNALMKEATSSAAKTTYISEILLTQLGTSLPRDWLSSMMSLSKLLLVDVYLQIGFLNSCWWVCCQTAKSHVRKLLPVSNKFGNVNNFVPITIQNIAPWWLTASNSSFTWLKFLM